MSTTQSLAQFMSSLSKNTLVYNQSFASSTWIINHNFTHIPIVQFYNIDGTRFITDYIASTNTITATFPSPIAGTAILV